MPGAGGWRGGSAVVLAALALCTGSGGSAAASASIPGCDRPATVSAAQQDRLLRFTAIVQRELDEAGPAVALIARSGTQLQRFGLRYSHAGLGLRGADAGPGGSADPGNGGWAVRQLYYACDERRPRLFDQGLAGFLFGTENPDLGYVSIVLLPPAAAAPLARAAHDRARALRLVATTYSANAHPFSLRYQNCNQWVLELMATAWGGLDDGDDLRARAQAWLAAAGYDPRPVDVGAPWLMLAPAVVPWLHLDDHPDEDRRSMRLQVSVPETIEAFVRARLPAAERLQLCHDRHRVVLRRGWAALPEGCVAQPGDRVIELD